MTERLVELCDSWRCIKIVFPKAGVKAKCLLRTRGAKIIICDKKMYTKWRRLILQLVRFGEKVGEHEWVGYGQGSCRTEPGLRRRTHEVYRISDRIKELIDIIEKVSTDCSALRMLPHNFTSLEDAEEKIKAVFHNYCIKKLIG